MKRKPYNGIEVNGLRIPKEEIDLELQYHPAPSWIGAVNRARRALVIRELLIQRAAALGLCNYQEAIKNPDTGITSLLQKELTVTPVGELECQQYYDIHQDKFMSSPLYEVSHILFLASPEDPDGLANAKQLATETLDKIIKAPSLFSRLAQELSACSSASQGGHLGQISKGQTLPAFEQALFMMTEGEISSVPVATEVGYHIIKVHRCVQGQLLPYPSVLEWIQNDLYQRNWAQAFHTYVANLASKADIKGYQFHRPQKETKNEVPATA